LKLSNKNKSKIIPMHFWVILINWLTILYFPA
jgi:hypothetical protein